MRLSFTLSGSCLWTKEVTAPLLLPHNPARREERVSCVAASAADLSLMQPPPDSPCPTMFSALALAGGEVTLHVNGRGCPFVQLPDSTCL